MNPVVDEELAQRLLRNVEEGYGMGGLSSGLYADYALDVLRQYLQAVATTVANSTQGDTKCTPNN